MYLPHCLSAIVHTWYTVSCRMASIYICCGICDTLRALGDDLLLQLTRHGINSVSCCARTTTKTADLNLHQGSPSAQLRSLLYPTFRTDLRRPSIRKSHSTPMHDSYLTGYLNLASTTWTLPEAVCMCFDLCLSISKEQRVAVPIQEEGQGYLIFVRWGARANGTSRMLGTPGTICTACSASLCPFCIVGL